MTDRPSIARSEDETELRRALRERDAARYTCEQLKLQKQTLRQQLRRVRAELREAKVKLEASEKNGGS